MSRILLADDSPHAQRMGELILREEGFEVVSVTDGETAVVRLSDVDPDVILADAFLPTRSGFEICRLVKSSPRLSHTKVVLTAGTLEPLDEEEARRAQADATIRKPFEASALVATVKPLVEAAQRERELTGRMTESPLEAPTGTETAQETQAIEAAAEGQAAAVAVTEPAEGANQAAANAPAAADPEVIRAAVTLALNESFGEIADEVAARVVKYLQR